MRTIGLIALALVAIATAAATVTALRRPAAVSVPAAAPPPLPGQQVAILSVVSLARGRYDAAENALQRTAARRDRAADIRTRLAGELTFRGWRGTLSSMTTTAAGYAAISVEIGPRIYLRTRHTEVSDDGTLIAPESPLFGVLAGLREGDPVVVSGHFGLSRQDGITEGSVSEGGSMRSPEFIARFEAVERP